MRMTSRWAAVAVLSLTAVTGANPLAAQAQAPPAPPPPPPANVRSDVGGALLTGIEPVVAPGALALPPLPALSASGWLVADLDSGQILAARDAHGQFAPASTLKTLTALTLIPRLPVAQLVTPTFDDIAVDGSKVGLVEQLAYPVSELFTALLTVSGNDAANTLATAAGGMPVAVELMNAEAARIHAGDTHVVNVSGLDAEGQVSSPYDLALIARAAMKLPDFRAYVATRKSSVAAPGGARFEIYNHNKLLGSYPGAIGIKNGYTVASRASFVAAATRDGHTLVVTLMRANPQVQPEGALLLDWGFAALAAGAKPVGTLVDPVSATAATSTSSPVAVTPVRVAALTRPKDGGGLPVLPAVAVASLLAAALVLSRRYVNAPARVRLEGRSGTRG
ncbi:MAG: Serine-type D-Ala-D-Ala carboxypeptidase [Frankiales bacterium]|nr:Serine-type D-Ala-D-Ala carboxypeptidase [Frankiales bacterium]